MKIKYLVSTLIILLVANACDEKNLDKINPNSYVLDLYYENGRQLTEATNAIYASVQSTRLAAREYFFIHDLRSDEMVAGGGGLEAPRAAVLNGTLDANNQISNWVWEGLYIVIMRANAVITNGPKVPAGKVDETLRERLIAEAKFLRGWAHFELVTMWGGVPVSVSTITEVTQTLPRNTEDQVYTAAIDDLKDAAAVLPLTYGAADLGRITKGAANAVLARAYMQKGDYANAKVALNDIITSNTYNLAASYFDNFTEEGEFNKESIWEIGYSNLGDMNWDLNGDGLNEKNIRTQEYSAIGWRNLIPSNNLLDQFERPTRPLADKNYGPKQDPRLKDNFYFIGDKYGAADNLKTLVSKIPAGTPKDDEDMFGVVAGNKSSFDGVDTLISWKKYSMMYKLDPGGFFPGFINQRMVRYAEVLLMMAECVNETGGSEADVLTYLNATRLRTSVDMPVYPTANYPTSSQNERRIAIMHEKRVEFAGEQIRNRDILRWRKLGHFAATSTPEPITKASGRYDFESKYQLLPIPQTEINNNDKIEQADQNPGY